MKINERQVILLSIAFPVYLFLIWLVSRPFLGQFYFSNPDEKGLVCSLMTAGMLLTTICCETLPHSSENPT
jgi:hypothetical protein